ncbi:MAG TPA: neutral zinc metallopeptidase [Actinotalea sp.]|nr:neutral zinc metallopeptidase [Actinotalea sp.]
MTFRQGGQFEGGRVRSGRGGRGAAAAGGGLGVVGLIVFLLLQLTGNGEVANQVVGGAGAGPRPEASNGYIGDCTAEQANTDPACRLSATVQSLDVYWTEVFAEQGELPLPEVQEFSGAWQSACGTASGATGPFYCPPDQTIYLDLTFFQTLQDRFGASDGPLAEMYVTAHEYGHHIQHVTGAMERADRSGTGADSDSVRLELQADCYAGLWAGHAATIVDPDTGVTFLEPISEAQLADALSAAEAVGDDHIQSSAGVGVNQDTWTHGSSDQRQRWFMVGYERGDPAACDTFSAATL